MPSTDTYSARTLRRPPYPIHPEAEITPHTCPPNRARQAIQVTGKRYLSPYPYSHHSIYPSNISQPLPTRGDASKQSRQQLQHNTMPKETWDEARMNTLLQIGPHVRNTYLQSIGPRTRLAYSLGSLLPARGERRLSVFCTTWTCARDRAGGEGENRVNERAKQTSQMDDPKTVYY